MALPRICTEAPRCPGASHWGFRQNTLVYIAVPWVSYRETHLLVRGPSQDTRCAVGLEQVLGDISQDQGWQRHCSPSSSCNSARLWGSGHKRKTHLCYALTDWKCVSTQVRMSSATLWVCWHLEHTDCASTLLLFSISNSPDVLMSLSSQLP